jgi:hypothetical protein
LPRLVDTYRVGVSDFFRDADLIAPDRLGRNSSAVRGEEDHLEESECRGEREERRG